MARKLRVEYPCVIYHITHRGSCKIRIFSDVHDREKFLLRLAESLPIKVREARLNRYLWSSYQGYADEDVSFRNQIELLPVETVIAVICEVFGVNEEIVYVRQRGSQIRPVTAKMLCKFADLTQRDVADILNLKNGVAVSCQLRKLRKVIEERYADEKNYIGYRDIDCSGSGRCLGGTARCFEG